MQSLYIGALLSLVSAPLVVHAGEIQTVTITGEEKSARELTSTVQVITDKDISQIRPAHPSEILNRKAGVHINNLEGEGHMTAIRQPITTSAAYLFLEDGLPTRPSGLFNHNALYEINLPQANQIEVIKGPGSALYGSESIGGIINVITEPSPDHFEFTLSPEVGSDGWRRALLSTGNALTDSVGFRFNLNQTENRGYREESEYSRTSTTFRLDSQLDQNTRSKTILAYSTIDQSGVDGLDEARYLEQSTYNPFHNDVGRRKVEAIRLSNEFSMDIDSNRRLTLTPFFRDNEMLLMPSWMLSYDPNDRNYEFQSYGLLTRLREKASDHFEWIIGVDLDYSPSTYQETRLTPTVSNGIYTSTTPTGRINYLYDSDQLAIAPYFHTEWRSSENLKLTFGLRYDYFNVDYSDRLDASVVESQSVGDRFTHLRPDSQTLTFEHLSPKLGAVYHLNQSQDLYTTYRHSFRAPSSQTLFRSGSSTNTDQLEPVITDSVEIGTRGSFSKFSYDITVYHMNIEDDIVNFIDQEAGDRKVANAGKTRHTGVEISLNKRFTPEWSSTVALSYTEQHYKDFQAILGFPPSEMNWAGNDVPRAPTTMGGATVRYEPLNYFGSIFELELNHLGEYYTDEANSNRYPGHTISHFRATVPIDRHLEIYGRIQNLENRVYSTYTSSQVGSPDLSYRPGAPRSYFIGFNYEF